MLGTQTRFTRAALGALIPLIVLSAGCSESASEEPGSASNGAGSPEGGEGAAVAPAAEEGPAGPEASGDSYALRAQGQPGYASGALGSYQIELEGRGGWHVNQDYPIRIALAEVEGLSYPKAELDRADAADFGDERARFEIPFTATGAGTHQAQAHVHFAMCNPENCVLLDRRLALDLRVE